MSQTFSAVGRTTATPELKYTQNGKSVTSFAIAINRYNAKKLKEEGKQSADFFNCVCFGKQAEFVAEKLVKGKLVSVIGEINIDQVEKDGKKNYYTKVICTGVEVLEYGNSSGSDAPSYGDFTDVEDDSDVPF